LHLVENRKNAEGPSAFLATYAPGLAAHGEVRHAPLGAARREYARAGAKADALLPLGLGALMRGYIATARICGAKGAVRPRSRSSANWAPSREAVFLLFDSVDITVNTFCWISFACAQGRIETE
jgi:hypothetical protein